VPDNTFRRSLPDNPDARRLVNLAPALRNPSDPDPPPGALARVPARETRVRKDAAVAGPAVMREPEHTVRGIVRFAVENGIQYNKNHGQRVPVVSKMDLNWGKA